MLLRMAASRFLTGWAASPLRVHVCLLTSFHSSVDGLSHCFRPLAIVSNAAGNAGVHISFPIAVLASKLQCSWGRLESYWGIKSPMPNRVRGGPTGSKIPQDRVLWNQTQEQSPFKWLWPLKASKQTPCSNNWEISLPSATLCSPAHLPKLWKVKF